MEMIRTISPRDAMNVPGLEHLYFKATESALENIRFAMACAGVTGFRKILDLPCGHGRVLRGLRAAFPDAEVTACDLDRDGVDFCARTFDAIPVYSQPDLPRLALPGGYDLIFCGSLVTHLPEAVTRQTLRFLLEQLAANGILLFTTHGRYSFTAQDHRPYTDPERFARIRKGWDGRGYGFAAYADSEEYGVSLARPSWVIAELERYTEARILFYREMGWDDHQDLFAAMKDSVDYYRIAR